MHAKHDIKVTIVDYGMGNLRSVVNSIDGMVKEVVLSSEPKDIEDADRIILPGVGHFGQGMTNLRERGLIDVLHEKVMMQMTPLLGICLGMQLLAQWGEEGNSAGLGWIPGRVVRFKGAGMRSDHFRIPHMGWNSLTSTKGPLFDWMDMKEEFYFCHSYHYEHSDDEFVTSTCSYGYEFVSSIQRMNVLGVQFHPEKSHDIGLKLIRNFVLLGQEESPTETTTHKNDHSHNHN